MTVISPARDAETRTLTITAEFDADRERVWQLWADPRQLERWWGPPTYPATVEDHDLTPGGTVTYFMTGPGTRKARNVARDPRCVVSVATEEFDLVVEGDAEMVTDPELVTEMADRWAAGGWPARVDDSGVALTADFSAPSAGPPPWHVYRITPRRATGLLTVEPGGATRWRF